MKEKPIIFSTFMARALLEGQKTQMRRAVLPQPRYPLKWHKGKWHEYSEDPVADKTCNSPWGYAYPAKYVKGDILWVREAWAYVLASQPFINDITLTIDPQDKKMAFIYKEDNHSTSEHYIWRSPIYMPRAAARIFRCVTDVRAERLQDITEADAIAEGMCFTNFGEYMPKGMISFDGKKTFHTFKPEKHDGWHIGGATGPDQCHRTARAAFAEHWDKHNAKKPGCAWADNPWVEVDEFERVKI